MGLLRQGIVSVPSPAYCLCDVSLLDSVQFRAFGVVHSGSRERFPEALPLKQCSCALFCVVPVPVVSVRLILVVHL